MCGICGQLNLDSAPVDATTMAAMAESIRHRGPDGHGVFVRGPVGLGHRRLSIIDLSDAGRQPMFSPDGRFTIVYNGEIYNYAELKRGLEGAGDTFQSTSDTEVLLRMYERMGPACLGHLRGMFAFAIWDESTQTLFLARDPIGIKPLYYYADRRTLVFGSEIKALLENPAIPREVRPESVVTYVTFGHSFAPNTIYEGVRKLLPGHYALCSRSGIVISRYWDLQNAPVLTGISEHDAAAEVYRRLDEAVTSHMVGDVPVGAFLSGGIDSSAVVAFMSKATSQPVKTFAIGFDVGGYFNELADARLVARQFRTEHHEKTVTELDVEALIERLVYQYDEPFADAANLPTLIVSEFAREHVKVVLSGEGGDEVFGGYRRYYAHLISRYLRFLPAFLGRMLPATPRLRRVQKAVTTAAIFEEDKRYGTWLALFADDARAELLAGASRTALGHFDGYDVYREYFNRHPEWDTANRILYTDLKTWLPDTYLEKIDKAAMAVGLEGRVPFLDHKLVEFAFTLPGHMKVRRATTKYILKKSLQGTLTPATLYKPKHGFAVPVDDWFRGRLKNFVAGVLFDGDVHADQYFDRAYVEKIFQQHQRGERDCGIQLWALVNFMLWHRRYMKAPAMAHS